MYNLFLLVLVFVITFRCNSQTDSEITELCGHYLGQKPPGAKPEVFAPGFVSTEESAEYGGHFSADLKEFYFTRFKPGGQSRIWITSCKNNQWTKPKILPVLKEFPGAESYISKNNNVLYFVHYDSDSEDFNHDIFILERDESEWKKPYRLTQTDLGKRRISPSVAENGNLYYSGDFDNPGQKDIYCSKPVNGIYTKPQNLGIKVNSKYHEEHVFVSPDESYILFDSYRPNENGKSDIYISFILPDKTWSDAQNLGSSINSDQYDWHPIVTPDEKYIIFSRTDLIGRIDILWVSAKIIEEIKPNK